VTALIEPRTGGVNPYLDGPFAPIDTATTAVCEVVGTLPTDLAGVFVRNGSNPKYPPPGRYHWFDGDGMLHALRFENGRVEYRNRYVATEALAAEVSAGEAIWSGINERPDFSLPGGPFKDTANTDLVFHDGRLLALWWLGGPCYEIDVSSL
jgi:carotenoid cleavage dioxygenase-like enzyme